MSLIAGSSLVGMRTDSLQTQSNWTQDLTTNDVDQQALSMDNPDGISPEPCEPGHVWNDETHACEAKVSFRSPRCEYGYVKNIRLDECRRVKYKVGSQSKGYFRKLFDKAFAKKKPPPATSAPVTRKTTQYTGEWYGYGYNYDRNERHW